MDAEGLKAKKKVAAVSRKNRMYDEREDVYKFTLCLLHSYTSSLQSCPAALSILSRSGGGAGVSLTLQRLKC